MILHKDHRNIVDIAEAVEAGNLVGGIHCNLTGGDRTIVGDKTDYIAPQTTQSGNCLASPIT